MGRLSDKTSAPIVSTLDLSANRSEPDKADPCGGGCWNCSQQFDTSLMKDPCLPLINEFFMGE
jgi:hypothetical protein